MGLNGRRILLSRNKRLQQEEERELSSSLSLAYNITDRAKAVNNGRKYADFETTYKKCGCPHIFMWLSGRGVGKSWSLGKFLRKDFEDNRHKFAMIRRNIQQSVLMGSYFADDDIYLDNNRFYLDGELIGINLSLHQYNKYKSSNMFQDVYNVVFEEFVEVEIDRYWDNEPSMLNNLLGTIFRGQSDCDYGRLIFVGNLELGFEMNPYFHFYNADFDYMGMEEAVPYEICNKNGYKAIVYIEPMGITDMSQVSWYANFDSESMLTGKIKTTDDMLENFLEHINNEKIQSTGKGYTLISSFCDITLEECFFPNKSEAPHFYLVYNGNKYKYQTFNIDSFKRAKDFERIIYNKGYNLIYFDRTAYSNYHKMIINFDFAHFVNKCKDKKQIHSLNPNTPDMTDRDKERLILDMVLQGARNEDIKSLCYNSNIPKWIYKRYGIIKEE